VGHVKSRTAVEEETNDIAPPDTTQLRH